MTKNRETSLHSAVLEDNLAVVRGLVGHVHRSNVANWLGFTALELAQLLDKQDCVELLGFSLKKRIRLIRKHETEVSELSIGEFEAEFAVHYLGHLKFDSYRTLQKVLENCPWILKKSFLGTENREYAKQYEEQLAVGYVAPLTIKWVDYNMGYGAFADQDMDKGIYIGEYTGLVRQLDLVHPSLNAYCFHYPTRFWSWNYYVVDSKSEGNELRFVNHSDKPNLQPICICDRGILHLALITNREVKEGEELTFNYGTDYWKRREKF